MIKMVGVDAAGNSGVICLIDMENIERMFQGRPLHVRLAEVLPKMKPECDIHIAYCSDLKKAADDLVKGVDIKNLMGSFEAHPLVAMVGLPRSGKSTLIEKTYRFHGYAVVNPDNVRLAVHGQAFIPSAEPFVWATVYAMVDALRRSGCNVVIDATNTTNERRKPWLDRGAKFHVLDTPKEECIERAKSTNREDLIPVIERMAGKFEPVEKEHQIQT